MNANYHRDPFEGYRIIERYGKYGFSNRVGTIVIPCKYDNYGFFRYVASVKLDNKWGLINDVGKEVTPFIYDQIIDFSCDRARVMRNGLWGFLGNNEEIIPCIYTKASDFQHSAKINKDSYSKNSYAIVWKDSRCGVINENGAEIASCKFDVIEIIFDDGLVITKLNSKYGVSLSGNEVISCVFDEIRRIGDLICVKNEAKWGVIHLSMLPSLHQKANQTMKIENPTNTSSKYLFFDTETTGVPQNYKAPTSDLNNWPRMVQLAWILCDKDGNELSSYCNIIKPHGFDIPIEASNLHKITTMIACEKGVSLKNALDEFINAAKLADVVICHNVEFDTKIVGAELLRTGFDFRIDTKPSICTMLKSTDFCAIPNQYDWGDKYKWPKLQELHKKLFGYEFEEAHDAMSDIKVTKKCFFELVKCGIISVPI